MPVQIGAPAHHFSDPTGLLSDCHRRIEMFLGSLKAVVSILDRNPDAQEKRSLDAALRYFREAAPKHNADEEESLFPRLRQLQDPRTRSLVDTLAVLEKEHGWAIPIHQKVDQLGNKYLASGALSAAEIDAFRVAVNDLAAMYQQHIAIEDQSIFPWAAQALPPQERAAIAGEMAKRRNVSVLPVVFTTNHPKSAE